MQKALVKECVVLHGHLLETLHCRSVDLLCAEFEHIGLPCTGSILEHVLYPHYLTYPISIGEFFFHYLLSPPSFQVHH
jgi:hypothetical protein